MATKPVILTTEGHQKLEQELEQLKTVRRKEVSEKIKVALSFGDLSENSEYDDARNEQAMVEARMAEVEQMLKNASVLDEAGITTDTIGVGSVIKIRHMKLGREDTYKIVGSTEASPLQKKISDESPVGKAMLGHHVGDVVEVETPSGIIEYEVLEIGK